MELGLGGGDVLGGGEGEGVGDSDSDVGAAGSSDLESVPCRGSIAFTSRTSILRLLKVASATESAESPKTSRSRRRLECIVARFEDLVGLFSLGATTLDLYKKGR